MIDLSFDLPAAAAKRPGHLPSYELSISAPDPSETGTTCRSHLAAGTRFVLVRAARVASTSCSKRPLSLVPPPRGGQNAIANAQARMGASSSASTAA